MGALTCPHDIQALLREVRVCVRAMHFNPCNLQKSGQRSTKTCPHGTRPKSLGVTVSPCVCVDSLLFLFVCLGVTHTHICSGQCSASKFNQDVSSWDTSKVTTLGTVSPCVCPCGVCCFFCVFGTHTHICSLYENAQCNPVSTKTCPHGTRLKSLDLDSSKSRVCVRV